MAQLNYTLIASLGVPVLAAAIGWFALWRRNKIIYKIENAHFCGDELAKAGFWENKEHRRPLMDAINFYSFNFGLKHLDEAEIMFFNVSDDYVVHPYHHNGIPENKWQHELLEDNRLHVKVRDIPAFERFGFSLLNTHPNRGGGIQGSGKNYRFIARNVYRKNLIRMTIGIGAFIVAIAATARLLGH